MLSRRHHLRYPGGPAGPGDEQGSLIVALIVIMVVVALGAALAARVIGNGMIVVARQNTSSALAAADAGLADALFRIDQDQASPFCVGAPISCVATSVPGAAGVSYQATQTSATQWTIESLGTHRGLASAVRETLTRSAQYPFALFGNQGLTFNGNGSNAIGTYSAGRSSVDSPSQPVEIGSNGTISCNGSLGVGVTAVYYTGGGGVSGSCGATQAVGTLYNVPVPQTPPGTNQGCPNNGAPIGAGNSYPTLTSGTWLCTQPVTINGNLAVSGTAKLYIILDLSTYGPTTTALDITAGSYVNFPTTAGAPLPDATQLQISTNSNGTVGDSHGLGYTFAGILDAPDASLTGNGCKSTYYGALVINTLTCNGGPNLTVYYEDSLSQVYGPWTTVGYAQIAPSSVTIG